MDADILFLQYVGEGRPAPFVLTYYNPSVFVCQRILGVKNNFHRKIPFVDRLHAEFPRKRADFVEKWIRPPPKWIKLWITFPIFCASPPASVWIFGAYIEFSTESYQPILCACPEKYAFFVREYLRSRILFVPFPAETAENVRPDLPFFDSLFSFSARERIYNFTQRRGDDGRLLGVRVRGKFFARRASLVSRRMLCAGEERAAAPAVRRCRGGRGGGRLPAPAPSRVGGVFCEVRGRGGAPPHCRKKGRRKGDPRRGGRLLSRHLRARRDPHRPLFFFRYGVRGGERLSRGARSRRPRPFPCGHLCLFRRVGRAGGVPLPQTAQRTPRLHPRGVRQAGRVEGPCGQRQPAPLPRAARVRAFSRRRARPLRGERSGGEDGDRNGKRHPRKPRFSLRADGDRNPERDKTAGWGLFYGGGDREPQLSIYLEYVFIGGMG